jgi:hypothetical protein
VKACRTHCIAARSSHLRAWMATRQANKKKICHGGFPPATFLLPARTSARTCRVMPARTAHGRASPIRGGRLHGAHSIEACP